MEELDISGHRYISTRRAAREHGYHSDYMGQLIRGGKVAGQKVGRAWYIDEESLASYLGKAPMPRAAVVVAEAAPVIEKAPEPVIAPEPEIKVEAPEVTPVVKMEEVADVPKEEPAYVEILQEVVEAEEPVQKIKITNAEVVEAPVYIPEPPRPFVEEKVVHGSMPVRVREAGGLRYMADDSPSLPHITRMPQAPVYYAAPVHHAAHQGRKSSFPYISLGVVGVLALLVAGFAANFVTVTVVSEEGKAATVQYAIHW